MLEIPKRNHRRKSTVKKRNTFLGVIRQPKGPLIWNNLNEIFVA